MSERQRDETEAAARESDRPLTEELTEAERLIAFQAALLNAVDQAVIATDLEGKIIFWNRSAETLYGWSAEDVMGLNVLAITPAHGAEDSAREIMTALAAGQSWSGEFEVRRRDGTTFVAHVVDSPIFDADGNLTGAVGLSTDISDRKRIEQALRQSEVELRGMADTLEDRVQARTEEVRALATALTLAEQRERHRIAKVLHDHLQQLLYALQFKTQALAGGGGETPGDLLDDIHELLGQAIDTTRNLAVDLSPPVLESGSLAEAVDWLARQVNEAHGLDVAVEVEHDMPLPDAVRVLLFQLLRELLFNVVKHADVDRARITVAQDGDDLTIVVEDQGAGFDPDTALADSARDSGWGLLNARERLKVFGGELVANSAPGTGTRMTIRLPLADVAAPASG